MRLEEAVVLVTGANGGIGRALTSDLARRRPRLLLHGRGGPDLEALADEFDATPLPCDLAEPNGANKLAAEAVGVFGHVDALVHCAGIGAYGSFAAIEPERIDRLLDVDLRAPMQLTRALLPTMIAAGGGHVAFVGSIAGLTGVAEEAAYSAVKAGLVMLAESLAFELAGTGVGVSWVCPGPVNTGFFAARGAGYPRRVPKLMEPALVAARVTRAIERDGGRDVLPRWLAIAPAVRALLPGVYYPLARRFG